MLQELFDPNEMTDEELDATILDIVRYEKSRNKVLLLNPVKMAQARRFLQCLRKFKKLHSEKKREEIEVVNNGVNVLNILCIQLNFFELNTQADEELQSAFVDMIKCCDGFQILPLVDDRVSLTCVFLDYCVEVSK